MVQSSRVLLSAVAVNFADGAGATNYDVGIVFGIGGGRGIRTPEGLHLSGFQDRNFLSIIVRQRSPTFALYAT